MPSTSGDEATPWYGQSLARPDASFSCVCCHRNSPVDFAERHQHAAVARLLRIAHRFVVRADEHHAAGDDRVAVALRSELGDPLHVLLRLDVPLGRQPFHVRDHVAIGRAAPHRPVAGPGIGRTDAGRTASSRAERASSRTECVSWSLIRIGSDLQVVEIRAELARRRRSPARPARLPIGSVLSIVHAAGSGCAGRPRLAPRAHLAVGQVLDAQLQVIPRVGLPRERHRDRALRSPAPTARASAAARCRRAPASSAAR